MKAKTIKTTAVFLRPFVVTGFSGGLPAGEYALEVDLHAPPDFSDPEGWKASVLVHLHPTPGSPGLARTLTVPLEDLERALARDKLTGQPLAGVLLEEMLADPLVRLFMESDGVTEDHMRRLHSGSRAPTDGEQ